MVITSAYDRTPTVRTDVEGRAKILSRLGKVIPDAYLAFHFGAKLGTSGSKKIWLLRQLTTERRPFVQTLRVGLKILSRVGKVIPEVYLAFHFGAKLTL